MLTAYSNAMSTRHQEAHVLTSFFCCLACRVRTVPLVCRAWRDAAKAPSIMWERVRLSLTVLGSTQVLGSEVSGEVYHPSRLAPWLAARSRSIHTLFICILNDAAALHMTEGCAAPLSETPSQSMPHAHASSTAKVSPVVLLIPQSSAACQVCNAGHPESLFYTHLPSAMAACKPTFLPPQENPRSPDVLIGMLHPCRSCSAAPLTAPLSIVML